MIRSATTAPPGAHRPGTSPVRPPGTPAVRDLP
ncbi:hypothetical protein SFUMM280S_07882 [Streptomyces fumanus]